MKLLSLKFEREVDVVAAAALLLALASSLWQLYGWMKGSRLVLFHPEQVLIRAVGYGDAREFVRFAAVMAYSNIGHADYYSIVKKESISFRLGGEKYSQRWQMFETFVINEDGSLGTADRRHHAPFTVNGENSISHETSFAPAGLEHDFIRWEQFVIQAERQRTIFFKLTSEILNEKALTVCCQIDLSPRTIELLKTRKYSAPNCVEVSASACDALQ